MTATRTLELRASTAIQRLSAASTARALLPWAVPALLLLLWTLAARFGWMSSQTLPAPLLVWQSAVELGREDLFSHLWISLQRLFWGLAVGVATGAVFGATLGFSSRAERLVFPTFSALAQIPTLAWIPLFMLLFGIGETLKLVVLVKAVVVPVTIHTLVGVRDAQPRLREAAAVLRLPAYLLIWRLVLPAALPSFMAGLRLALATGWSSLLAVELLASSEGIGYLMVWGRQLFMLDVVFVCILIIGVVGVLMERGITLLDRHLLFWPHPPTAEFRRRPMGTGWQRWQPWLLPLGLVAVWQTVSAWQWVDSNVLVSPWQVALTTWEGLNDGTLLTAMGNSLLRALGGLLVGGGLGFLLGVVLGLSNVSERLLGPSFSALRQIAIFAWVPLLTAWFGLGELAKLVFVGLAAFFPLLVATQRGIRNLSPQLGEAAQALRLNLFQRLRLLILPGATAAIFAGLRLGLIYAWLGTIGAEYFMASGYGIGTLMIGAQQLFRMDQVMAAMLVIGFTGAALNALGQFIEARATRWRTA